MSKRTKSVDPQSVFCEVCLKQVPRSEALMVEGRDHVAYFCGIPAMRAGPVPAHRKRPCRTSRKGSGAASPATSA